MSIQTNLQPPCSSNESVKLHHWQTIQIKPLKLCRTKSEFGEALDHFVLVEIRDENGQTLQAFHLQDLGDLFLD